MSVEFNFFPDVITKSVDNEEGFRIMEGYASTSDLDFQGDVITDEALELAQHDLLENSTVLYNHNLDREIGKVLESRFTEEGLFVKVQISKTEDEIWSKIQEGILNKFSIRAKVLDREKTYDPELGQMINVIKKIKIVEVSVVSVPANSKAYLDSSSQLVPCSFNTSAFGCVIINNPPMFCDKILTYYQQMCLQFVFLKLI